MKALAVVGWPLVGTASPSWHRQRLGGRPWSYRSVPLRPPLSRKQLRRIVEEFLAVNITSPHKGIALECADRLTHAATQCKAVNLLIWKEGSLVGDNTDLPAFARTFRRLGACEDQEWLVLGSGGAARAVSVALEGMGASSQIVSRSPIEEKGEVGYEEAISSVEKVNGVVNATSVPCPPLSLDRLPADAWVVDLSYGKESAFLTEARQMGLRTEGGWGMFVDQARLSARRWKA
ncbi:hypothetical protein H8D30_00765 [bacterium]|nr:hypothetical protein [bacterium]